MRTESRVLRWGRYIVSKVAQSFDEQTQKLKAKGDNGARIETYDDKLEEVGLLRSREALLLQSVLSLQSAFPVAECVSIN